MPCWCASPKRDMAGRRNYSSDSSLFLPVLFLLHMFLIGRAIFEMDFGVSRFSSDAAGWRGITAHLPASNTSLKGAQQAAVAVAAAAKNQQERRTRAIGNTSAITCTSIPKSWPCSLLIIFRSVRTCHCGRFVRSSKQAAIEWQRWGYTGQKSCIENSFHIFVHQPSWMFFSVGDRFLPPPFLPVSYRSFC